VDWARKVAGRWAGSDVGSHLVDSRRPRPRISGKDDIMSLDCSVKVARPGKLGGSSVGGQGSVRGGLGG
jgi:hypothetical protein